MCELPQRGHCLGSEIMAIVASSPRSACLRRRSAIGMRGADALIARSLRPTRRRVVRRTTTASHGCVAVARTDCLRVCASPCDALSGSAELSIVAPASRGPTRERRVRPPLTVRRRIGRARVGRGGYVGGVAAQDAIRLRRRLDRRTYLLEARHALARHGAAVRVRRARVRAIPALKLGEAGRRAMEGSGVQARKALGDRRA
jgi:hypothetical protein